MARIIIMLLLVGVLGLVAMLNVPESYVFPTGMLLFVVYFAILFNFAHHKGMTD